MCTVDGKNSASLTITWFRSRKRSFHTFFTKRIIQSFCSLTHQRPIFQLQVVAGAALASIQDKCLDRDFNGFLRGSVQDPATGGE